MPSLPSEGWPQRVLCTGVARERLRDEGGGWSLFGGANLPLLSAPYALLLSPVCSDADRGCNVKAGSTVCHK